MRPNATGLVLGRANIAYELSARTKGTAASAQSPSSSTPPGLASGVDASLQLLKLHKPYHESDHVSPTTPCAGGDA